jgi:hypothetical protein
LKEFKSKIKKFQQTILENLVLLGSKLVLTNALPYTKTPETIKHTDYHFLDAIALNMSMTNTVFSLSGNSYKLLGQLHVTESESETKKYNLYESKNITQTEDENKYYVRTKRGMEEFAYGLTDDPDYVDDDGRIFLMPAIKGVTQCYAYNPDPNSIDRAFRIDVTEYDKTMKDIFQYLAKYFPEDYKTWDTDKLTVFKKYVSGFEANKTRQKRHDFIKITTKNEIRNYRISNWDNVVRKVKKTKGWFGGGDGDDEDDDEDNLEQLMHGGGFLDVVGKKEKEETYKPSFNEQKDLDDMLCQYGAPQHDSSINFQKLKDTSAMTFINENDGGDTGNATELTTIISMLNEKYKSQFNNPLKKYTEHHTKKGIDEILRRVPGNVTLDEKTPNKEGFEYKLEGGKRTHTPWVNLAGMKTLREKIVKQHIKLLHYLRKNTTKSEIKEILEVFDGNFLDKLTPDNCMKIYLEKVNPLESKIKKLMGNKGLVEHHTDQAEKEKKERNGLLLLDMGPYNLHTLYKTNLKRMKDFLKKLDKLNNKNTTDTEDKTYSNLFKLVVSTENWERKAFLRDVAVKQQALGTNAAVTVTPGMVTAAHHHPFGSGGGRKRLRTQKKRPVGQSLSRRAGGDSA